MMDIRGKKHNVLFIILVNMVIVILIVHTIVGYSISYRTQLHEQNIADITNLNQASSNIISAFFYEQRHRLSDVVRYITNRNMSRQEALAFIRELQSDKSSIYEIVNPDGVGQALVVGTQDEEIFYTSNDYASMRNLLAMADATLKYMPEFTDAITVHKSFALYSKVPFSDGADNVLLSVFSSDSFENMIDMRGGYDSMSTVLVDKEGNYIFGSSDFKSDNLFKYFYTFNNLSRDQRNALAREFGSRRNGLFQFKNSRGELCVFVYAEVPDTDWVCVSCVPLSSFHVNKRDYRYTLMIIIYLVSLLAIDLAWMYNINKRLKESVDKEKIASEAKTDFLSRMSHDIRTPLNVIIGTTYLAEREESNAVMKKYLSDIDASGKFLLSLVNDILDLNKVEQGKMELHPVPYSFAELKSNLGSIITPLCKDKGIKFSITIDEQAPAFLLDSIRVNQILFNLLSNSAKFTPIGGTIELFCSYDTKEALIDFVVKDNGCGMSEAFQKHMFEAFTQEQNPNSSTSKGTGLGLAIVKNLVSLMEGNVEVQSELGKGSSFHITLPAILAKTTEAKQTHVTINEELLKGKRVLVFEDNAINAQIALHILMTKGLIGETAANGKQGLDLFIASPPNSYDAILMDLRMPEMDGLEATRAIRNLDRPDARIIPIIAMTANAYDSDVRNCLDAGMNAHLAKPINPDLLFSTLSDLLK